MIEGILLSLAELPVPLLERGALLLERGAQAGVVPPRLQLSSVEADSPPLSRIAPLFQILVFLLARLSSPLPSSLSPAPPSPALAYDSSRT